MSLRQPIISVLGHVGHGKTTLLDRIRGTSIAAREHGKITQHIGATEVPIDTIYSFCKSILGTKKFNVPGLLFIDTPGHQAFTTLRSRGGALADLAVLVVDIREGLMPQSIESLRILKKYKTPFVVVANKIDLIPGWRNEKNQPFVFAIKAQRDEVRETLDTLVYSLSEQLYNHNFSAERYDRIEDFTRNVAIVPASVKYNIGIQDLLMVLVGVAQRFLEKMLRKIETNGVATVLEVKEEKGLGKTIDAILYQGTIRRGDILVIEGIDKPVVSKVKVLLRPVPNIKTRFISVPEATATVGVKIAAPGLENVKSGGILRAATIETLDSVIKELSKREAPTIPLDDDGVVIKADAIGSLEALAYELREIKVPIKKAEIGDISKRDLAEAQTTNNRLFKVILGYNVKIGAADPRDYGVTVLTGNVLYQILQQYNSWHDKTLKAQEEISRKEHCYPVKFIVLENAIFRVSKPAIVGVRVLGGVLRPKIKVLKIDGRVIGTINSIRENDKNLEKAEMGQEVAISIDNAVVGRNLKENDVLYTDLQETDANFLKSQQLTYEEREILDEIIKIKRLEKPFWGA